MVPYAAIGSGPPVVICAGLWPTTGVDSGTLVRGALSPVRPMSRQRRLIVLNRRPGMPVAATMREIAAEYADAIQGHFGAPVDVLGTSTGGSIAQQLAADHPHAIRRLVLLSTACRLGPVGRDLQAQVATELESGRIRSAAALAAANLAPRGLRPVAGGLGWAAAGRMFTDARVVSDLVATLRAEDGFDLATCPQPIQAPTLIVAGGRDRFYSAHLVTETAALIPNSTLRSFPRRGHMSVANDRRARATIAGFLLA